MRAMSSQITGVSIVCSTVCSCADQRKHQSSASLAFMRGIHRGPWFPSQSNAKMLPFDDVNMWLSVISNKICWTDNVIQYGQQNIDKIKHIQYPQTVPTNKCHWLSGIFWHYLRRKYLKILQNYAVHISIQQRTHTHKQTSIQECYWNVLYPLILWFLYPATIHCFISTIKTHTHTQTNINSNNKSWIKSFCQK